MKQRFFIIAASVCVLVTLVVTSCEYDDSEIWERVNQNTERIVALEAWQAEVNTNIQSLQTLLNTADYITAVTPVTEAGVEIGYTITFLNSPAITIYHGQKGDTGDPGNSGTTPEIGVVQDPDGNWYWTLNGAYMTDANGDPVRANGENGTSAPVPQLQTGSGLIGITQDAQGNAIEPDAIYLSVDSGQTWTRVSGEEGEKGEKGDKGDKGDTGTSGDSFFSSVDTSDPTCVTFTLADGTTSFSIPCYTGIKLDFDVSVLRLGYENTQTVNFTAEGSDKFTTDNLFIVAPDGWKASVSLPTRTSSTSFALTVTAPSEAQLTEGAAVAEGDILVVLDNGQNETAIGRIKADCKSTYLVMHNVNAGDIAAKINHNSKMVSITVTSGTLNENDWNTFIYNKSTLVYIDVAGADYTEERLYYNNGANLPIVTAKLPGGVTSLAMDAFYDCWYLTSVTLPDELETIEDEAFYSCSGLTSITLPAGLTTIGEDAFAYSSLDIVTCLAETPPSLGNNAFLCSLTNIYVPAGAVDAYKTAWSEFADIITAIP